MKALELKIKPPYLWMLLGAPALLGEPISLSDWQLIPLILLLVSAGILGSFGLLHFYRSNTTHHPHLPHHSSALVTGGVYRFSRNPMYLGLLCLLIALYLGFQNVLGFVMVPIFVFWLNRFQIGVEERVLQEKFGDEYARYCQSVRRWI